MTEEKFEELRRDKARLEAGVEKLKKENAVLRREVARLWEVIRHLKGGRL